MTFEEMRKRYRKEELGYSEQSAVAEEEQDLKERARTGSAFDDYSFRRIQELYITGQLDNPKPAASSSSPKLDYGTKKNLETLDFEKKYDGYSLANLSSAYADTDNKDEQAWIENKIQQSNSREDIQKLVDALHKSGESDAQRMKEGYVYDGYNQTAGERLAHMSARYQNQISMLERVGNRIKRGQSADAADKEAEKKYGGMSVSELMDAYYGSSDNEKQWITSRLQSTATADDYTAKIDELSDKITRARSEYDKLEKELDHLDGERYDASFERVVQLGNDIGRYEKQIKKYGEDLKSAKLRDRKNEYMQLRYSADFVENSYSREKEQERSDWDNRKYMTADEQAVYNYLYNTQGEEKAEDFFKSMESELNKRMTVSESQKAADFAEAEPVLSSVVSIGQNLVSGAGAVEDIGRAITGQPVDQNSALHIPSHLATAQRQAVAGNIDNDLGKWVYNTAMSAADSATNILVAKGVGSVAGALGASASAAEKITVYASDVLMGSQVATQTVIQAKDKGLTDSQAVAQGVIHGLIEGVTEHFSVENILADPRNFRQTLLKSFVAEGSEEVAANWLDRIADSIIEGDEYEKRRKYEEYLKQGMSDTEALTNIVIEYLGEDADSFLAGGVSGVAMSAASHGYNGVAYDINQAREKIGNHMANTAVGKAVIQGDNAENEINDLINDGKNLDKGSAGYKLAQKLEEKQGHGKKLSASEIGKLYGYVKESKLKFVTANMSEEEQATVINAAEKLSNGQALSDEEVKAINDSPNAAQAIAILTGAEENETNSLVERQSESTAEYKTSSSGKTEADGKEFTGTLEIKSIDRQTGDVTYNLIDTDGTTEERSVLDLQFDSDETTQLHKKATAFSNINEANAFVDSHEKGQDVDEYTREWDLYSNYGRHSLSLNEQGRMDNGYVLSDEQKMTAYSYGLENYKSVAQRRKIASDALRASASFGYEQGTFNSTVSPKKRLNKEQKNVISALKIVSGAGINVEVFESKADKSGAFIGENGSFDVATKTLRVDINAGYNTVKECLTSAFKYGMLNTAAHELTHVAKHSGSWDELRNAVINVMEMGGEDFAKLTDSKLTQLQKSGKYQDYTSDELDELAEEEAICEACETMLQDGSLFEELVRENPKQANKLLEALKKVLDSVRNFFKRNGKYARNEQGKALLRALDKTESDLQAIWNNAVKEGIQAVNAGVESKGEIKEQARKKQKYEKQGGEWSDALTGAEWAKYNNAITSGVDAGLRISDNSILVECEENNIYQYKFVIYDNTFEDNPITSIYAIGNIDYNVTNANKLAQIIYEMENRGYGQKVFDKGLRRYAKGYKILLGKYNRKSNRYNQYGQSVATARTNIKNQSNGTATYTTAGQIKFSDRIAQSDTDYLSAVERGDMETAQRMVDEAAERAFAASKVVEKDGKPLVVYHQTDADFTVFVTENKGAGRYDDETPAGIFLKPTNADIGLQGQKQMALYADIKNPLSVNSREDLVRHYSKNINGYTEAKQTIKDIDEAYGKIFKEEEKRENVEYQKLWEAWRNGKISKEEYRERASRDKLQEILDEWENKTNEARENVKDLITNYFKNSAFDGIILEHDSGSFGRSVKTYIAFNTEQIKSADPVTYDDEGKVIPLSERFKTDKKDIRYQDRTDTEDLESNRYLLASALESVAKNEKERLTAEAYKGYVSQLNDMQNQLSEINAQIKEISFTKGSDRSKLHALYKRKKALSDKLSRYDKHLLNGFEVSQPLRDLFNRARAEIRKDQKQKDNIKLQNTKDKFVKHDLYNHMARNLKKLNEALDAAQPQKRVKEGLRAITEQLIGNAKYLLYDNLSVRDIVRGNMENAIPNTTQTEKQALKRYADIIGVIDHPLTDAEREELRSLRSNELKSLINRERTDFKEKQEALFQTNFVDTLDKLSAEYTAIQNSELDYIKEAYDSNIAEAIANLRDEIKNTPLTKDLTVSQLKQYDRIITMISTTIRKANRFHLQGRNKTVAGASQSVMKEIEAVRGSKETRNRIGKLLVDNTIWKNLKPYYAFNYIGSDTLMDFYWKIQQGEQDWMKDMDEARSFILKAKKDHRYNDFDFKSIHTFTSVDGSEFKLTKQQMMSLYAASRREQALHHLLHGGFTFERDAKDKHGKIHTGAKTYTLTAETVTAIQNALTADERAYVQELQQYLSQEMARKGNEVSMELYGVSLFNEDTYWSIKTTDDFRKIEIAETKGEFKRKNAGFTKQTVKNASNPIVLQDFDNAWAGHVNEMSLYHAMTLPIEDFTKVYGYKINVNGEHSAQSVRAALNGAYGDESNNYLTTFLRDINGDVRTETRVDTADKLIALSKKAAVMSNISVVVQQPMAAIRAMMYINPRFFSPRLFFVARELNHTTSAKWEQLKQYVPVAELKEMGMFDVGMGRGAIDWLNTNERDKLFHSGFTGFFKAAGTNIKDFLVDGDYREEVLSYGAARADEIAWVKIWDACQRETKKKYGYKIGTNENLQKSSERFNEVIHKTQVYDSVLTRSHNMRSKSTHDKVLTAYMAEPTTIMNMAFDACVEAKRSGNVKKGASHILRAVAVLTASMLMNNLLKSVVSAMRDDDDDDKTDGKDESFGDKYWQSLCQNINDDLIPANYFPLFKDVVSIIQGYDAKRMDMTLLNSAIGAISKGMKAASKDELTNDNIIEIVASLCNIIGLPIYNIKRDVMSVFNTYDTFRSQNQTVFQKTDAEALLKYNGTYEKKWKNGEEEADCLDDAIQAARGAIKNRLKPLYLEAVEKQDTNAIYDIRKYMNDSGYYKDLKHVDKTLDGWRTGKEDEDKRTEAKEKRKGQNAPTPPSPK